MRFNICLCVFIVPIHVQMLIFPCSLVIVRTRLLCAFYNKRMHIFHVPKKTYDFSAGIAEQRNAGKEGIDR